MNNHHVKVDTFGPSDELSEIARRFSEPIASRIDRLIGVLDRHPEQWEKYAKKYVIAAANLAAGSNILNQWMFEPALEAKSLIIDNLSGYWLYAPALDQLIPPQVIGFTVACIPAVNTLSLAVFLGTSTAAATVIVTATERLLGPSGGSFTGAAAGGSGGGAGPALQPGARVAMTSSANPLNAGAQTTFTFAKQVNHWRFQNSSTTTKWIAPDDIAGNGYLIQVQSGQFYADDAPLTTLSVWSSTADAVGTSIGSLAPTGVTAWGYA